LIADKTHFDQTVSTHRKGAFPIKTECKGCRKGGRVNKKKEKLWGF